MYAWLSASRVRHAMYRAQGSTARLDARIRKVEEDIDEAKQAQLKCQQAQLKCRQDIERRMQTEDLSKADTTMLPLLLKERDDLAEELKELREEVKQLREELKQLREERLLLLRQSSK